VRDKVWWWWRAGQRVRVEANIKSGATAVCQTTRIVALSPSRGKNTRCDVFQTWYSVVVAK
jgi:hypothetical protein